MYFGFSVALFRSLSCKCHAGYDKDRGHGVHASIVTTRLQEPQVDLWKGERQMPEEDAGFAKALRRTRRP